MTKMTVLHFASPFAFSMPAPSQAARTDRDAVSTASASEPSRVFLASSMAGESTAERTSSDGAGFEASLYDTVLRRYGEQVGAAEETAGSDQETVSR